MGNTKQQIDYRGATVGDVDGIFRLVNGMAESGQMLRRSKYRIVTMLANFMVAESQGGELSGCGTLFPLWTDSAEIVALAVDPRFQGSGVGRRLVGGVRRDCHEHPFGRVKDETGEKKR